MSRVAVWLSGLVRNPGGEDPNLSQTGRYFSKIKFYTCGQLGHVSTNCELQPREKVVNSRKV